MKTEKWKLVASTAIFGTIGLARKCIPYSSGLVAFARGLIGALFLLAVHLVRHERFPLDALKRNAGLLLASGVVLGVNWMLLFEAYRYTTVSVATICYYMAPVMVILISPALFREKLTRKKALCALCALIGMVLVSGVLETGVSGLTGVAFGLGAAVMYAAVMVLNKKMDGLGAGDRTIFQLGIAAAALLPYVLLTEKGSVPAGGLLAAGMLLLVGIVHTGIAFTLYFGSIGSVPAQTAALLSYIDPVVAVLLSALVLREPISAPAIFGVALVVCSAAASELDCLPRPRKKNGLPDPGDPV